MDKGHEALISDLRDLLDEAEKHEFHDFANRKYATPKVELAAQLFQIRKNVIDGKYDN